MRFEVLIVVFQGIHIFWDVTGLGVPVVSKNSSALKFDKCHPIVLYQYRGIYSV